MCSKANATVHAVPRAILAALAAPAEKIALIERCIALSRRAASATQLRLPDVVQSRAYRMLGGFAGHTWHRVLRSFVRASTWRATVQGIIAPWAVRMVMFEVAAQMEVEGVYVKDPFRPPQPVIQRLGIYINT